MIRERGLTLLVNLFPKPGSVRFGAAVQHSGSLSPAGDLWHKPLWISFLLVYGLNLVCAILRISPPALDALLVVSASLSLLAGLGRRLPPQNIVMGFLVIVSISSIVLSLGAQTGIPFGPIRYTPTAGAEVVRAVAWPLPLVWVVAILGGRGIARLIMRPWRKGGYYGFWVIGCTAVLAILFDLSLEPYASTQQHYWFWTAGPQVWNWYRTPWTNFMAWGLVSVAILVAGTPWFINKQPVKAPPDYHPLLVWSLISFLLAVNHVVHQRWLAAIVPLPFQIAAIGYAIAGARW